MESQGLAVNKPSNDDDLPLQITNDNQNWFVASLESTNGGDGCLVQWMTPASSTYWWSGAWGTNVNQFNMWFNYQGLPTKPTGGVSISGNLDVGTAQATTSIKACVNHDGYQGNIQIEPRWGSQGFIHFHTNYPEGVLLFAVKEDS